MSRPDGARMPKCITRNPKTKPGGAKSGGGSGRPPIELIYNQLYHEANREEINARERARRLEKKKLKEKSAPMPGP